MINIIDIDICVKVCTTGLLYIAALCLLESLHTTTTILRGKNSIEEAEHYYIQFLKPYYK